MALPTPENIQLVTDLQTQFGGAYGKALKIHNLLGEVFEKIRQDKDPNLNANADWDAMVLLYGPTYTTELAEFKALVAAL
jgi:hypothetical protein